MHHTDRGSRNTPAIDYTQTLADHGVLASVGSVGDAYDNALAESFVDTFKTELIADRVWRTRAQLELAIVEYVGWFNTARLHEALGDLPPAEFEALYAARRPRRSHPHMTSGNQLTRSPRKPGRLNRVTSPCHAVDLLRGRFEAEAEPSCSGRIAILLTDRDPGAALAQSRMSPTGQGGSLSLRET